MVRPLSYPFKEPTVPHIGKTPSGMSLIIKFILLQGICEIDVSWLLFVVITFAIEMVALRCRVKVNAGSGG